ncbi:MAG: nitrogen fixation protein NifX [Psychromonas sp.]|jgi:nitrogen fixation protein NifX|uniref:NifB/NifX family molybdenum-iron cluster-binding protein n=1 Tax=Psychromonas sp. TaxID=1884585 RepID=UPI0039E53A1B
MTNTSQQKLKIAFASSNNIDLDEHFGTCFSLCIYALTRSDSEHLNTVLLSREEGHQQQKISDRLLALEDCFAVYCLACGNPVRRQLLAQGTRVIIQSTSEPIANLLMGIQNNWPGQIAQRQLRQRRKKQDADYFEKLADGEWDEQN